MNRRRTPKLVRVLLACLLAPAFLRATGYQMSISFTGYVGRAESLTNFPVLVVLSNNVGGSGFNYASMPFQTTNGTDLRIRDALDTTDLNYEIEVWNTNGPSLVWVQVPTLPADGTGSILAKWGDATYVTRLSCTTNGAVWSNGFRSVYHFAETSGNAADATANRNTATNVNVTYGAGRIGNAALIDGETDSFLIPPVTNSVLSASVWYYYSDVGSDSGWNTIFVRDGGTFHHLLIKDDSKHVGCFNGTFVDSLVTLAPGNWYYFTVIMSGTSYRLYINGVQVQNTTGFDNSTSGQRLSRISTYNGSLQACRGILDEVRIDNLARSTNWAWACFLSQGSNTAFCSYGQAQSGIAGAPSIVNTGAFNVESNRADLVCNLLTGNVPATVTCYWGTNDAGTVATAWDASNTLTATTLGYQTNSIPSGLQPGARYYFRFYVTNNVASTWAVPSILFYTPGPPSVNNADGATRVGASSATLNGALMAGSADSSVWIYYGTSDGGMSKGAWNYAAAVGQPGIAAFSAGIAGLLTNQAYYYRCYASNSFNNGSEAWAPASAAFTTYPLITLTNNSSLNNGATMLSLPPVTSSGVAPPWTYTLDGAFVMGGYQLKTDNGDGLLLDLGGPTHAMTGSSGTTNFYTYLPSSTPGSVTIRNAGSISLGLIDTHSDNRNNGTASGGNVSIGQATGLGSGPIAGNIRADAILCHVGQSGWNSPGAAGTVQIYGTGDVKIQSAGGTNGDINTSHWTANGGAISVQHRGAFAGNTLFTGAHAGDNYITEHSGNVLLNGAYGVAPSGSCQVRGINTSHRRFGGNAGNISVLGYTSLYVGAGGLLATNDLSSGFAGNIVITNITGNIQVDGPINAFSLNSTPTNNGTVFMQAGGSITLANLDVSLFKSATFSAGGNVYITGTVSNFPVNTPTNGLLDMANGGFIQYSATVPGNAYLGGKLYRLKSGGRLKPQSGSLVIFR
jgi:hypothetical protein